MLTATQIAAIVMLLQAFGVDAQTIANVQAGLQPHKVQTSIASTTDSTAAAANTPYAVSFSLYHSNPAAYLNKNISVSGMESALIPSTGAAGSTNFIQLTNPFDLSLPIIEAIVPSGVAYTAVVNAIHSKYMPAIRIYGVGVPNQTFVQSGPTGSSNVSLPVISATRIDLCTNGSENTAYNGSDFDSDYSCSAWKTLIP